MNDAGEVARLRAVVEALFARHLYATTHHGPIFDQGIVNDAVGTFTPVYERAQANVAEADLAKVRLKVLGLEAENRELRKPFDDVVRVLSAERDEAKKDAERLREALEAVVNARGIIDPRACPGAGSPLAIAREALAATAPKEGTAALPGHTLHGRWSEGADGPDDPDCPCRATARQVECAAEGCGFCRAAEESNV